MVKLYFTGQIVISFPWDLPQRVSGPAVMFDVNAASHNIAYLLTVAKELFVVHKENVYQALKSNPDAVLIGESDDQNLQKRFFVSNHASAIHRADLKGKKVILITNNGTHTLNELWVKGAIPIIAGHYVNLRTVTNWVLKNFRYAPQITFVPAGGREVVYAKNHNLLEDLLCAQAMEKLLRGKEPDLKADFKKARKYIDETNPQYWPTKEEDLDLIFSEKDLYSVVPACVKDKNGILRIKNLFK